MALLIYYQWFIKPLYKEHHFYSEIICVRVIKTFIRFLLGSIFCYGDFFVYGFFIAWDLKRHIVPPIDKEKSFIYLEIQTVNTRKFLRDQNSCVPEKSISVTKKNLVFTKNFFFHAKLPRARKSNISSLHLLLSL